MMHGQKNIKFFQGVRIGGQWRIQNIFCILKELLTPEPCRSWYLFDVSAVIRFFLWAL